jgi:hypothetical protein
MPLAPGYAILDATDNIQNKHAYIYIFVEVYMYISTNVPFPIQSRMK